MPMNPRLLRPIASGAFDPRSIAGLGHWWDASDSSKVTLDSGRVSTIVDKVAANNGVNTVSGNTQPQYVLNARNGRNVMQFVAAQSTVLTLDSAITPGDSGNLIFSSVAVMFRDSASDNMNSLGFTGTAQSHFHRVFGSSNVSSQQTSDVAVFSGTSALSLVLTVVRNAGTSILLRNNGVEQELTSGAAVTNTTGARLVTSISRNNTSSFTNGYIGEMLVWQRLLTLDERVAIERALARKWGITLA